MRKRDVAWIPVKLHSPNRIVKIKAYKIGKNKYASQDLFVDRFGNVVASGFLAIYYFDNKNPAILMQAGEFDLSPQGIIKLLKLIGQKIKQTKKLHKIGLAELLMQAGINDKIEQENEIFVKKGYKRAFFNKDFWVN